MYKTKLLRFVVVMALLFHGHLFGFSQKVFSDWVMGAGTKGWDIVNDIACDDSGNVYITGSNIDTIGKTSMSGNATNARKCLFIARYDSSGKLVWNKNIRKSETGYGSLLAFVKPDQIIMTGGTESVNDGSAPYRGNFDFFISALDLSGKITWTKSFSGTRTDFLTSMIVDTINQEILIAGYFHDTLMINEKKFISKGRSDGFVLRFDMVGNLKETQIIGGKGNDNIGCLSVNVIGDRFTAGTFQGKIQFAKDKVLELSNPRMVGLFLTRTNSNGNFLGAKQIVTGKKIKVTAMVCQGEYTFMTGSFSDDITVNNQALHSLGSDDIFLLCIDSALKVKWHKQIGGIRKDRPAGLINTGKEIILTGSYCSELKIGQTSITPAGKGSDLFLISLDPSGRLKWMRSAGGESDDYPTGIEYSSGDYIYMAGSFRKSFNINSEKIKSNGEEDLFICRLENCRLLAPEFKRPQYLCDGFPLQLDAGQGFSSYNWADGLGMERVLTVVQPGEYSLELVAGNGCMVYDTIGVMDVPSPVINLGNDTTLADTARIMLDASKDFAQYLWNNGATKPEILVKGIDLQEGPNLLNVTVTSDKGCVGHDDIVITMIRTIPNHISELVAESCTLFPNPTRDIVTVYFTMSFESLILTIHDLMGKEVIVQSVSRYVANVPVELDLAALPKGLYTIKIKTDRGDATKKIVLQ
jgi:hypothetical protein